MTKLAQADEARIYRIAAKVPNAPVQDISYDAVSRVLTIYVASTAERANDLGDALLAHHLNMVTDNATKDDRTTEPVADWTALKLKLNPGPLWRHPEDVPASSVVEMKS